MPTVRRLQHSSVPMPRDGATDARRFYGGALGLEEVSLPESLHDRALVWFSAGDGHEIHCFADEHLGPNSPQQHFCLEVDDLDAYRTRLDEHGVATYDSTPIHNRPRFFVRDPFGNQIELTQILGPYK
ncbi:MAG: VOC family protein [Thermomicrobiales bacterium]|nr:VOC family protein [Thermomicrobiales bacterium]